MKKPVKILLSSRDPGAAGNIIELYRLLTDDACFDVSMIASGSASGKIKDAKLDHIEFKVENGSDHVKEHGDPKQILDKALSWLDKIKPEHIITSISSLGSGIDEALIYHAKVPVFAFQDFWGDVNCNFGRSADEYFVLDKFAARLSHERWRVKTRITGMPKYMTYKSFDFQKLQYETRKKLGIKDNEKLIGWFGQPSDVPGHVETFDTFIKSCTHVLVDFTLMIKTHPKDDDKQSITLAKELGLKIIAPASINDTDALLAASDLVVTPFSLCGLDHAVMSSFSPFPLGTVLYLMPNQKIRNFAQTACGIQKFPIVETSNAGVWIDTDGVEHIAKEITRLLSDRERKIYYSSCQHIIKHFDYQVFRTFLLEQVSPLRHVD